MREITSVICEDEPIAAKALEEYLGDVDWVSVVGIARNGREALRVIHKHEPELVFLDVQLPGITGIEVLERLTHQPAIIFTTAHGEYALPAFEHGAVDYLLKPFGKKRLFRALDRIRVKLAGEGLDASGGREKDAIAYPKRLFARREQAMVPVPVSAIVRAEAEEGGVALVTGSGVFHLDRTLTEVQERLDPGEFIRVHRGHIVNLSHVREIRRYDERRLIIELSEGSTVVTSRPGAIKLRAVIG